VPRSFQNAIEEEEFDTVGGLIMSIFGRMLKRGEFAGRDGFEFEVLHSDTRRVYLLRVIRESDRAPSPEGQAEADSESVDTT